MSAAQADQIVRKQKNAIKSSPSRKVFVFCNTIFFIFMLFMCAYPLYYVLIQSLSGGNEGTKALLWPINFTFNNFQEMLTINEIGSAILISVVRTVLGTVSHVFCCMMLGYLYTKDTMPFRKVLYRFMVITMYVGGGMIPTYLVMREYGLVNSFWIYVIPSVLSAYHVILVKTFVESIPKELEESARIDGASTMKVFLSIILPLSLPIAATLAIYASNSQWNSWWDNQLYNAARPDLTTLQLLLYRYLNQADKLLQQLYEDHTQEIADLEIQMTTRGLKMTVTMISVIPILCVYPFMQRFLIKGIMVGAVKG